MSDKTNDIDHKKIETTSDSNEGVKEALYAEKTKAEVTAGLKEQVNDLPMTKALNSFPQMKQSLTAAAKEGGIDDKTLLTRLGAIHANLQNITAKWFPTIKNPDSQNHFATAILITGLNVVGQKKGAAASTANSLKGDLLGGAVEKLMTGFSKVESSSAGGFIGALNDLPGIGIKLTNMIKYFGSYTGNVEFATANDALQFVNNPAFDKAEFNVGYDDKTQEALRQIANQKNISLAGLNATSFDKSIVAKIDGVVKQTTAYKTRIEKLDPGNLQGKVENMADVAVNLHSQVSAMAEKMGIELPDWMQIDKGEGIAGNIPGFILLIAKLLIPNLDINQFDRAVQRRLKLSPEEVENIQVMAQTIPAPSSDKDKIPQDKLDALGLNAEQLSAYQQVNLAGIKKAVRESNPQIIPDFKIKQYVGLISQSDNQELKSMVEGYKAKDGSYDIAKLMGNKEHIGKIIGFIFDQSDVLGAAAKIEGLKLDSNKLTQLIIAEAVKGASKYEQAGGLAARSDKPQTAEGRTDKLQAGSGLLGAFLQRDIRNLADQYPNQAWAKNNNPAGITWNNSFDAQFPEKLSLAERLNSKKIRYLKGSERPEGGNYVAFNTIGDGISALVCLWEISSEKGQTIGERLKTYAVDSYTLDPSFMNKKFGDLTSEQKEDLILEQIKRESGGLHNLITQEKTLAKNNGNTDTSLGIIA